MLAERNRHAGASAAKARIAIGRHSAASPLSVPAETAASVEEQRLNSTSGRNESASRSVKSGSVRICPPYAAVVRSIASSPAAAQAAVSPATACASLKVATTVSAEMAIPAIAAARGPAPGSRNTAASTDG